MVPPPINLPLWLKDNSHLLQPPVGNHCLYRTPDYTVMLVGGPNARSDYHYQPTEELFYQLKGDMLLKIVEDGEFKDIRIGEGEIFVLPAYTPHSPCRFADTIGLVVERTRPEDKDDALRWYCPNLSSHTSGPYIVKERTFHCVDLGTQLKPVIQDWLDDEEGRKCKGCGYQVGKRELIGAQA